MVWAELRVADGVLSNLGEWSYWSLVVTFNCFSIDAALIWLRGGNLMRAMQVWFCY